MTSKPVEYPDKQTECVKTRNVGQCIGQTLTDIELPNGEVSGSKREAVLHFSDGGEILIFVHDDGTLMIEGD